MLDTKYCGSACVYESDISNRYSMNRVFYEIYSNEHEGEAPRASCHVYYIKHEDFVVIYLYPVVKVIAV